LILGAAIALLALPLAAAKAPAATQPGNAWSPCGDVKEPRALWACWGGRNGSGEGVKAATCVKKTACPPRDQHDKPVLNCHYESSFSTGFRCIVFCNYGGAFPWGSDGGSNCD
jgi:hypothetical protein